MGKKFDTVYVNGKIYTANVEAPFAEAMAVKDGRVAWIGNAADVELDGETTVDLKGRRVVPGFVDSHMHPIMLAATCRQISVLPPKIHSLEELAEAIRKVREEQGPDRWVLGWGYDEGKLAEHRSPNRYDLDKGAADVPVSIVRTCGHIRCLNSKALEIAGITKDTPDPEGGQIDRDENGEPTGILRENARNLILPFMEEKTKDTIVDELLDLSKMLLSQGVTTIADMANTEKNVDSYASYEAARKKGFQPRVASYYFWDNYKNRTDAILSEERVKTEGRNRVAGVKLVGDGSVSGRTAWCDQPYLNGDDCGICTCTDEDLAAAIAFCKENKCQLAYHAMGAKAIDKIVDATWQETPWTEHGEPYVRLEHVAMPSKQATERAAKAGIAYVTQPIFLYAEIESYLTNLGPERTKENYNIADWIKAGVKFSFSTDAPATAWATPSDPMPCLKCAVTRVAYDGTDCGQRHRVDIRTAIDLYTAKSAPMLGFTSLGQLKPGYFADFVVLDRDILEIPSEEIDQVKVLETYMDGVCVYNK